MSGIILAVVFRKQGPVRPKYQYEVERELGIDPPDLEGEWLRRMQEQEEKSDPLIITYQYIPKRAEAVATPPDVHTQSNSPSQDQMPSDPNQENQP